MTRPNVELVKIRSISEVIDDSVLFVKQNWKGLLQSYFSICGFFWVATIVISIFNQIHFQRRTDAGESMIDGHFWFGMFFGCLNHTVTAVAGLSFMSLYHQKGNVAPTTAEVWSYFKYFFLRVLGGNLLIILCLSAGAVFCFFPMIYLWPVLSLVPVAIVIDNYPINGAFSYSFNLISTKWGQVFGALILCCFLIVSAALLLGIPLGGGAALYVFLSGDHDRHIARFVITILFSFIQFFFLFPLIVLTLSYFNLKEQQEDHRLFERIKKLGVNDPKPTDHAMNHDEEQY